MAKLVLRRTLTLLLLPALLLTATEVYSNESRTLPPLRPKAYRNLELAQQYVDNKAWAEAEKELAVLKAGEARLNAYERALMYNLYGFMAFSQNELSAAIEHYQRVLVAPESIPLAMETATHYGLAQLYFGVDDFTAAISAMRRWEALADKQNIEGKLLIAQSYYQLNDYANAIPALNAALALHQTSGEPPQENWLLLLRLLYFENAQPQQALAVMAQLVELYPQARYYLQLATLHGQLGNSMQQLGILESLEADGLLNDPIDITNLANLYLMQEAPLLAARVLQRYLADGRLTASAQNLQLTASALALAKEYQAAAELYQQLSEYEPKGDYLLSAAQMAWLAEDYGRVVELLDDTQRLTEAKRAEALLLVGMSQHYSGNFDAARATFQALRNDAALGMQARRWLEVNNSEQQRLQQVAQYR